MDPTPQRVPSRGPDNTCSTRPLFLAAVLVIAGHQIQGTAPDRPAHSAPPYQEVTHHG
jgi:hypothetical protein